MFNNMDNKGFYKAATGIMVANALANCITTEMAAQNRREALKIAQITNFYAHYLSEKQIADKVGHYIFCKNIGAAYDFLNNSLKSEIIHDCQNQKEFTTHLSELIEQRKDKYRPFYDKIERSIPDYLEDLTAEELCSVMSVELMTPEQLKQYHCEKTAEENAKKFAENAGLVFRGIIIIGLVALMIYLSTQ